MDPFRIFFIAVAARIVYLYFNTKHAYNAAPPNIPKIVIGNRIVDLMNAIHFDDVMQDSPTEIRAPALVVFYNSTDETSMRFMELTTNIFVPKYPARERLFIGRYDVATAHLRPWYKWTPEMDLLKRFPGVDPNVGRVFVSRQCDGYTDWCVKLNDGVVTKMGCDYFTVSPTCTEDFYEIDPMRNRVGHFDTDEWMENMLEKDGEPKITKFLGTYKAQGEWMRKRDHTTTENQLRNTYLSEAYPNFTETGFKAFKTPDVLQAWFDNFIDNHDPIDEYWHTESTQLNFIENTTKLYNMDESAAHRDHLANTFIKPLVEEWSGIKPLVLTSFYGIREYPNGSVLKNHLDRIDTHILSVTFSIRKGEGHGDWPLEVVQFNGEHVRYEHPPGTMVFYESSKLPHGRPYHNTGGNHFGAFMHFKPADNAVFHTQDAADKARAYKESKITHSAYFSVESVEPENPVYSHVKYGEKSSFS